jgi:DNA-binding NarL/FixJ family response regulator
VPRILIADDHGLYRKGLRSALEAGFSSVDVLEADCMESVLATLELNPTIEMVLLDLNMPGLISFESLRAARECYPQTRFAILSASDAKGDILSSLAAGLHAFISKLQPDEEIISAVKDVLAGRIYVPPWLAQVGEHHASGNGASVGVTTRSVQHLAKLTPRQRDVLPLLARGLSNKEIARVLNISEATT